MENKVNLPHQEILCRVGRFNRLPKEVISEVITNGDTPWPPDSRLEYWLKPENLVHHFGLFALAEDSDSVKRVQPPTMNRGLVDKLWYPVIDFYGHGFAEVGSKGNGMTTQALTAHSSSHGSSEPLGLFGRHHSLQEQTVSNPLAHHGGRVSRVLGTLVLDHQKLRLWIDDQLGPNRAFGGYKYDVYKALEIVEKNGDQSAICVRLMGAERRDDLERASFRGAFSQSRMVQRAAAILLEEISFLGEENFKHRYGIKSSLSFQDLLFDLLINPNSAQIVWLGFFRDYFNAWNSGVKQYVSKKYFNNQLSVVVNGQNSDILGNWYDFETSLPGPGYTAGDLIPHLDPRNSMKNPLNVRDASEKGYLFASSTPPLSYPHFAT